MSPDLTSAAVETIMISCGLTFLVAGSHMIQKAFHQEYDAAESFLAATVLGISWIVITGQLLGALGMITIYNRILTDAAYLAFSLAVYRRYYPIRLRPEQSLGRLKSPAVKLILILAMTVGAALWLWAFVSPPPPWDAFVYHLYFPASWIDRGAIFPVTVPFGDQAGTYFPSNVELIYLWVLQYLGQDFGTNIVQFFFLTVAATAAYRLARICGASRAITLCAVLSIFFMPSIAHQAAASEVDVAFTAFFITSLYFILRWYEDPERKVNFVLSCLCAGLFVGTKSIAIPFALFLLLPVFAFVLYKRKPAPWLLAALLFVPLTGAFWYARNLLLTGNPIFPLAVNLGDIEILRGAYTRETMLNSLFHTDSLAQWFKLMGHEWGYPFLFFMPLMSTVVIIKKNMRAIHRIVLGVFPFAIMAICFFLVPYNREVRFTYTAFVLGAAAMGVALTDMKRPRPEIFAWALAALYVLNPMLTGDGLAGAYHLQVVRQIRNIITAPVETYALMRSGALVAGAGAFILAATLIILIIRQRWSRWSKPAVILSLIICTISIFPISANYPDYQYDYYASTPMGQAWKWLHSNIREPANIAFTGTDIAYGLVGPRLRNDVYYVPVNKHGFSEFHECNEYLKQTGRYTAPTTDRIDFCRRDPDPVQWIEGLRRRDTDMLFISVLHQNDRPHLAHDTAFFPIERAWADANPRNFKLLFASSYVRIYEVVL